MMPADEEDDGDWQSCIMEGYLQKRGGKSGGKSYKQRFFRLRENMLVVYKKQKKKNYGKNSGTILQKGNVLAAVSLDDAGHSRQKNGGDAANSFLVVTPKLSWRLAAKTSAERDDWVAAINTQLVKSTTVLRSSEYGFMRVAAIFKILGKEKRATKHVSLLYRMYRTLELECRRDYTIGRVLEKLEAAEAVGRDIDLEVARQTQEAFWLAQEAIEAIKAHIEMDRFLALFKSLGLGPSDMKVPEAQVAFQKEVHDSQNMFKSLVDVEKGDVDFDEVFSTEQQYEGPLSMHNKEDSSARKKAQRWVVLYEHKLAWWKSKKAKDQGKKPDGFFELRDLLQAENTAHMNFRVTHFDDARSCFFFTANEVETERWLDKVAYSMIKYNKADKADVVVEYEEKSSAVHTVSSAQPYATLPPGYMC